MPFYPFDKTTPGGATLRAGLDNLRLGRYQLAAVLGNLQQMTAAQAVAEYGFADATTAQAAMNELLSDIQKMLSDVDTGVNSAVVQMLNEFG